MSDVKVLHPDRPKVYAMWTVIIGGGKSPNTLEYRNSSHKIIATVDRNLFLPKYAFT